MTLQITVNMEEREALKKQIEILQNLISNHKRVHGNNPSAATAVDPESSLSTRGRGPSLSYVRSHASGGKQQPRGNWRKTYSLSNKTTQPTTTRQVSAPSASHTSSAGSLKAPDRPSRRGVDAGPGIGLQEKRTENPNTAGRIGVAENVVADTRKAPVDQGRKTASSSEVHSSFTQLQNKPCNAAKARAETIRTVTTATPPGLASFNPAQSGTTQPGGPPPLSFHDRALPSKACGASASVKQSKFTWVKNQPKAGLEAMPTGSLPQPPGKRSDAGPSAVSNVGVPSRGPSTTATKRTPSRKSPLRLSLTAGTPRTSKYTWVSSSAGGQARLSRKPTSPKALVLSQRSAAKGEVVRRVHAVRSRKGAAASGGGSSCSRYRWRAGGRSPLGVRGGTVFQWTSERSSRGSKGGAHSSPSSPSTPPSSADGFKLRSRMKIIRKSPGSGGGASERRTWPSPGAPSSRPLLRGGWASTPTRGPTGVRKGQTKELVSFGRHKLRRLSPGSCRKGHASPCQASATHQRVFRTRYKMVTSPGLNSLHYSPPLSWRTKRIQSARSLLQSRLRAPQDRHQPSQHWRGRGMLWIGGSLYRVSANKLSRTAPTSTPINRTGKWSSPIQFCSPTPPAGRYSISRSVASRAVQRSLAIIRNARHRKQQPRHYCMYYNRFGKCNRGNGCPYIHDPDKVAVCTRFLRGTCKQAVGTCPFSHKVDKEKMPVCSYFLRGICNNSSCPYSHVYVSRTAAVCEDFIKGYCPQGEKCKKKHTLVCPDFSQTGSCPRGSRCKLHHRQRPKHSPAPSAAKRPRTKEPPKRPRLSVVVAPATPDDGLKLPSFISLSSSPEEAWPPDTPSGASPLQEKKLQIKPRL